MNVDDGLYDVCGSVPARTVRPNQDHTDLRRQRVVAEELVSDDDSPIAGQYTCDFDKEFWHGSVTTPTFAHLGRGSVRMQARRMATSQDQTTNVPCDDSHIENGKTRYANKQVHVRHGTDEEVRWILSIVDARRQRPTQIPDMMPGTAPGVTKMRRAECRKDRGDHNHKGSKNENEPLRWRQTELHDFVQSFFMTLPADSPSADNKVYQMIVILQ